MRLVTHERCLDGATCAVLGRAAGMEPAFVYPDGVVAYLRSLPPDEPVVLADVSFDRASYDTYAPRLVALIDHHQSALPLRGLARVHLELDHCASVLLYRWLTATGRLSPDPAWEPLLAAVDAYDLWRPDHRLGQDLNRLLHDRGWSWFAAKFARGFVPLDAEEAGRLAELVAEEEAFVRRHRERAEPFSVGNLKAALVSLDSEGAVNEVAHRLIEDGVDLVLLVKPDGRLSARSSARVDAARLMERAFGGGGHPRAAGGRLPAGLAPDAAETLRWVREQAQAALTAPEP